MRGLYYKIHKHEKNCQQEEPKTNLWIAWFLALAICCIYVLAVIMEGSAASYDHGLGRRIDGVLGCAAVALFYFSWKWYKKGSITKSILTGIAALAVSSFDQIPFYLLWDYFIIRFLLIMFVIFIVKKMIWSSITNMYSDQITLKRNQNIVWFACLGTAFAYFYLFFTREDNSFSGNGNQMLSLCIPLIYPLIFKWFKEHLNVENTEALLKISIGYFGSCTILHLIPLGLRYTEGNPFGNMSAGMTVYYVLMGVIIYAVEVKGIRKQKQKWNQSRSRAVSILLTAIYIIVCMSATFSFNLRAQKVFCHADNDFSTEYYEEKPEQKYECF